MVEINSNQSVVRSVTIGVPQGSILGPLLFPVFINNLAKIVNASGIQMYGDDLTLSLSKKI